MSEISLHDHGLDEPALGAFVERQVNAHRMPLPSHASYGKWTMHSRRARHSFERMHGGRKETAKIAPE